MLESRKKELVLRTNRKRDEIMLREGEWRERAKKFRLAMKWIDEHRQEFLG